MESKLGRYDSIQLSESPDAMAVGGVSLCLMLLNDSFGINFVLPLILTTY